MGQSHGENSAGTGPSSPLPSAAESIEYSITMTAINREIIATQWQWTNLWQPFQLFFSRGNLYHCLGNVEPQCAASTLERFYKRWLNEEQRAKFFLTPHKPSQLHEGGGEVRGKGQRGHCSSTAILTETEKEKKKERNSDWQQTCVWSGTQTLTAEKRESLYDKGWVATLNRCDKHADVGCKYTHASRHTYARSD